MIRRPPRSTLDRSSAASDVYKRQAYRILRPNGSLFVFAYPSLAAYVEVAIGKRFNVLNHIVWNKTNGGAASRNDKTALRSFIPLPERCLLYTSDAADERSRVASGASRYNKKKNKQTTKLA